MSDTALLCNPIYFDVTYSINPWMSIGGVDKKKALQQWTALKETLESIGVKTRVIKQASNLPDMVFTANAGTVHNKDVVLSNFKHKERKLETEEFFRWFSDEGYNVHRLPSKLSFEGCGDTIVYEDKLIAGYGFRSDLKALKMCSEILNLDLTYLKLVDPSFYHLDTCFSLLRNDLAIYYPGAFSKYTVSKIKDIELIPVSKYHAKMFACNSVVYGKNILMPYGNNTLAKSLEERGYKVYQLDTSEFIKSGGSLQCMVLWI